MNSKRIICYDKGPPKQAVLSFLFDILKLHIKKFALFVKKCLTYYLNVLCCEHKVGIWWKKIDVFSGYFDREDSVSKGSSLPEMLNKASAGSSGACVFSIRFLFLVFMFFIFCGMNTTWCFW